MEALTPNCAAKLDNEKLCGKPATHWTSITHPTGHVLGRGLEECFPLCDEHWEAMTLSLLAASGVDTTDIEKELEKDRERSRRGFRIGDQRNGTVFEN